MQKGYEETFFNGRMTRGIIGKSVVYGTRDNVMVHKSVMYLLDVI